LDRVALAEALEAGGEAGEAGADDEDAEAGRGVGAEGLGREEGGGDGWVVLVLGWWFW
jgi:hypothetical protein